jgi:hypothetical protein
MPPNLLPSTGARRIADLTRPVATFIALLGAIVTFAPRVANAQGAPMPNAGAQAARVPATHAPVTGHSVASEPFAVEYYYKIRWGFVGEWMELYKRNHYPILLKQQEMGRIVRMSAATPVNHAGEAGRWDFRFTIVWKDAATAHDDFDSSSIVKALYPDQERFAKEEQRRFELLLEHMDIPIWLDDLKGWKR